jgi:hypothetical protein
LAACARAREPGRASKCPLGPKPEGRTAWGMCAGAAPRRRRDQLGAVRGATRSRCKLLRPTKAGTNRACMAGAHACASGSGRAPPRLRRATAAAHAHGPELVHWAAGVLQEHRSVPLEDLPGLPGAWSPEVLTSGRPAACGSNSGLHAKRRRPAPGHPVTRTAALDPRHRFPRRRRTGTTRCRCSRLRSMRPPTPRLGTGGPCKSSRRMGLRGARRPRLRSRPRAMAAWSRSLLRMWSGSPFQCQTRSSRQTWSDGLRTPNSPLHEARKHAWLRSQIEAMESAVWGPLRRSVATRYTESVFVVRSVSIVSIDCVECVDRLCRSVSIVHRGAACRLVIWTACAALPALLSSTTGTPAMGVALGMFGDHALESSDVSGANCKQSASALCRARPPRNTPPTPGNARPSPQPSRAPPQPDTYSCALASPPHRTSPILLSRHRARITARPLSPPARARVLPPLPPPLPQWRPPPPHPLRSPPPLPPAACHCSTCRHATRCRSCPCHQARATARATAMRGQPRRPRGAPGRAPTPEAPAAHPDDS